MQILNRLSKIFKANFNTSSSVNHKFLFNDEEDELKSIIDELNNSSDSKSNTATKDDYVNQNHLSEDLIEAYSIIGVPHSGSIEDIKQAYKSKMKEYHPDKVAKFDESIRKKSEKQAKLINEAYSKIRISKGF
ncbi:MAG: J domain-containing protein [Candidatus Kapaibacterium sp.]|jgi:DnaJ-domain-containing protein 1|nr:J domain-containing protein [Candidatus Kapabacteria bacterium]